MPVYKVNVKWGKEKYKDVECSTDEDPLVFKTQLCTLTGVEATRQKIMLRGTVLKDAGWSSFKLKDGATLLMMGTKEALPDAPAERPLFIEDMTEEQLASVPELPAGLNNLGNTCYLNASLQCLRSVPELKDALQKFQGDTEGSPADIGGGIVAALRDLYVELDKKSVGSSLLILLQNLHAAFPHFAERTEQGLFQQQDANECWIHIVRMLQQKLPGVSEGEPMDVDGAASPSSKGFMDQYFRAEFDTTLKCVEAEDENPTSSKETFYQLSCYISRQVKYMFTGLKSFLAENIEKNSPSLQRNAQYIEESKLSRLPAYLTIQMVRFQYKEKERINAKILKDVKFSMVLDVWDLCSETLQEKLVPMRNKFKIMAEKKTEEAQKAKQGGKQVTKMNGTPDDDDVNYAPYDFPEDKGSNNSGFYTLQAVLTHQGRSSSSGHYVSWVRREGDDWIKFDDNDVSPVTSEDILRLSGGGDRPCAYVLLYGPQRLDEKYLTASESKEEPDFPASDYFGVIQTLSENVARANLPSLCAYFALVHSETEAVIDSESPARQFLVYLHKRGTIKPDDMTFLVEGLKEVNLMMAANKVQAVLQEDDSEEEEVEDTEKHTSEGTASEDKALNEVKKLLAEKLCKICLDKDVEMLFLPCRHLVTCSDCAERVNVCPMCRVEIGGKMCVFM